MAGVSTATVSRVINQTAWVEPVTRERVEKAMRDLNYRRNAAAIALAKRSGDMLGLLTGNLADPFFAHLARGVEDVSRKQQYRLMVCSGGHDEEMEKAGLDFLVNQGCEAIVVHASRLPDKELLRYAAHFPALVVVNRYIAGMANRCIWLENRSAAREATRYLLANGHRRIACVTSDLPIIDRQERLDGYREALEEYGISPDPRWVISVPFNEEGGERAAHQLINSGLPLTAAVTFNDVMAAGIMRILHQRGVQLPQQLSIVGFDDVVLARYLYPALTTMHYPVEQMARCAAQLAIQLYQGITPPPSSNHFNAELVFLALISATKSHRCPTRLTLPRLSQTLLCLSIFSIYFGRPCQVSCLPPWFILSPDTVICWARWPRRSALRTSSTRWSRYTILILFLFCRR